MSLFATSVCFFFCFFFFFIGFRRHAAQTPLWILSHLQLDCRAINCENDHVVRTLHARTMDISQGHGVVSHAYLKQKGECLLERKSRGLNTQNSNLNFLSILLGPLTLKFDRATWPFLKIDMRH